MGLYVPPGEKEADFTFFTAIWGMPSDTKCTRWADGWGRRLDERVDEHEHPHTLAPKLVYPYDRTFVNDDSAIIVDRKAIPSRVVDLKEQDVLIFEASKEMKMPNKFEPFSPTVFRPRASGVAPFPKTGEYTIAIWAADGSKGTNHYSLGLGLKERDVFAMQNLLLADFNMFPMLMWVHWNPFVVILPMLICFGATQYLLVHLTKTSSDPVSVFQWIVCSAASILIG